MLLNQSLSAKERKDLLARLSDQQVRDVIWDLIETSSSPTDREAAGIAKEVDDISARLRENAQQLAVHLTARDDSFDRHQRDDSSRP